MELVIKPEKRLAISAGELWRYRELFYFFAWRDVKVRYKQTAIGASWAIVQPLLTMLVFTLLASLAGIRSGSVPYPVFAYAGLLYWTYFTSSLLQVSNSMVANQSVITKLYFPRIIVPIAALLPGVVDFFFASIVFSGLMIYYQIAPSLLGVAMVVPMLVLTFMTSMGLGMFFAALNVKYRDIRAIIPFIVQLGLFLTPVIYPVGLIPARYQWIESLNPMAGVITTMRAGLLHQGSVHWGQLAVCTAIASVLVGFGVRYFTSTEREFADIL